MENRLDGSQEHRDAGRSSNSLVWLLGQMIRLPLVAFSYGMEMFVKTIQGITKGADQSIGAAISNGSQTPCSDKGGSASERSEGAHSCKKGGMYEKARKN